MFKPCESKLLNLYFKIKLPEGIGLLPAILEQSLALKNSKPITLETWDKTLKIELINKNFHWTTTINKNEEIARLLLLPGCGEMLVTRYKFLC